MAANTSPTLGFPISAKDFDTDKARATNRLLDYYEGRQLHHIVNMLDGKYKGYGKRHGWRKRGLVPRVRNITKKIVDSSGLLFNKPPKLLIVVPNEIDPVTDDVFNTIMESADWVETFQNVDVLTRLLKSVVLLQQRYIPNDTQTVNGQYKFDLNNNDALYLEVLHQGNAVVKMNPIGTEITALGYITSENGPADLKSKKADADDFWSYRLVLPDEIIDVNVETGTGAEFTDGIKETIVARAPNPDGFVPASFFYDTNKPRKGAWVEPPQDLTSFQELLNLFYCDQELAMAWQKHKTAVLNGTILSDDQNSNGITIPSASIQGGKVEGGETWENIAQFQAKSASTLGGLGGMIKLGVGDNGEAADIKFVGPDTNLLQLQQIITQMAEDLANDWDVNLKYGGGGSATSGFQVVVEESNNLQLRERRSWSMQAGMRRFYEIFQELYKGQVTEGMLQPEFAAPYLPVNLQEQEQIWSMRIDNNRASLIDYFMTVCNMTEAQAEAKMNKVITQNNLMNKLVKPPVPVAPPAPTTGQIADKTSKPVKEDLNNG